MIDETWLYKNQDALNLVIEGLQQALNGEFVELPNILEDLIWLDSLDDIEILTK